MSSTVSDHLSTRVNNFDFIRFCAALAVIYSHAYKLARGHEDPLMVVTGHLLSIGDVAVAVFFVISGMLIAQSFDRSATIGNFVEARFLRIYPALIATVVATVFILGPLMTSQPLSLYFGDATIFQYLNSITALKIQYFLPGVFEKNLFPGTVNGSLWTLPIELACYAAIATIFSVANKRYFQSMVMGIVVLVVFGRILVHVNTFYFGLGAVIYLLRNHILINKFLALLSLIIAVAMIATPINPILFYLVIGVAIAYLTLYFGFIGKSYFRNFAKHGDFSYGLYIWAFPIQQIVALKFSSISILSHFFICAVATLALAIPSWYFIEKPSLKLKGLIDYSHNFFYAFTDRLTKSIDKTIFF